MDLYILNSSLQRIYLIDNYESLTWVERFNKLGDAKIVISWSKENVQRLKTGSILSINKSNRLMIVDSVTSNLKDTGERVLEVQAYALEIILENRPAKNTKAGLKSNAKWILNGTPGWVLRTIFNTVCRSNTVHPQDNIPFLQSGTIMPSSTLPEPTESIEYEVNPESVLKALLDLSDKYKLGFRLVHKFDTPELYFDVYTGNDRTTYQTSRPAVVFSSQMNNIKNTSELTSINGEKNVAYVYHDFRYELVVGDSVAASVTGFDRKVLYVDVNDIELPERPYDLTEAQKEAIKAAQDKVGESEDIKDALNELSNKKRLTAEQKTLITTFIAATALTEAQRNYITAAVNTSWAYNGTEDAYLSPVMQQRGHEELAKYRRLFAMDGEIPNATQYVYNTHYHLGDFVEMRGPDGTINRMRVVEQIFSCDSTGVSSYPSLIVDESITPDTWLGWDPNEIWTAAVGTWSEV